MDFLKNIVVVLMLYVGIVHSQAVRRRRPQKDPNEVVFPKRAHQNNGQNHNVRQARGPLSETGNCVHHLCSNVTNYPRSRILSVMSKKKEFHRFFGSVIQPYHLPTLVGKAPKTKDSEDKNMCETVQFTYFPEMAMNQYNKRMVVVNVDKFRQAVSFETCVPKAKCFLADHKPLGYETSCKQQYNLIRLVSMTEDGNITLDSFPIPSSCVCTYRRIVGFN